MNKAITHMKKENITPMIYSFFCIYKVFEYKRATKLINRKKKIIPLVKGVGWFVDLV
jgi:hypothetical protein